MSPSQKPGGKESLFLAAMGRSYYDMRSLENRTDIKEIEAVLFKV
jgi:hypothetical protein